MPYIDALSLAPDARGWLTISPRPNILQVFDRVCRLIKERMEALSIVTRKIPGKSRTIHAIS